MLSTASSPSRAGCVYALASLAPVSVVLALFLATRKPGSPMTLLVLQLLALPLATGMLGFVTEASAGARKGADTGARAVSRGVRVGVVVAVAWVFILLPLSDLQPGPLLREFEFALSRTLYFDFLVIIPAVAVQGMAGAVAGLLLFKEGERGRTVLRLGIPGAFPQRSPDPPPSAQARARGDSESVVALVLRGVRTFTVSLLVSIPMSVLVSVVWPRAAALLSLLPLALGFLGSAMPLPGEGDEGRRSAINRALAALGCVLPGALLVAGSAAAHTLAPDAKVVGPSMGIFVAILVLYEVVGAVLLARPFQSPVLTLLALVALPCALAVGATRSVTQQSIGSVQYRNRAVSVLEPKAVWQDGDLTVEATVDLTRMDPRDFAATTMYHAVYRDSNSDHTDGVNAFDLWSDGIVTWLDGSPPKSRQPSKVRLTFFHPQRAPTGIASKHWVIFGMSKPAEAGVDRLKELRIDVPGPPAP